MSSFLESKRKKASIFYRQPAEMLALFFVSFPGRKYDPYFKYAGKNRAETAVVTTFFQSARVKALLPL